MIRPCGMQSITFGVYFNRSLEKVTFPNGLLNITFGENFNQCLERVTLPSGRSMGSAAADLRVIGTSSHSSSPVLSLTAS